MNDQIYEVSLLIGYSEPDRFGDLEQAKRKAIERSLDDDVWGIWQEGDGNHKDKLRFIVFDQTVFTRESK